MMLLGARPVLVRSEVCGDQPGGCPGGCGAGAQGRHLLGMGRGDQEGPSPPSTGGSWASVFRLC